MQVDGAPCLDGVPVALKKFPTDIPLTWNNEGLADRSLIFAASLSSERETLLGYRTRPLCVTTSRAGPEPAQGII